MRQKRFPQIAQVLNAAIDPFAKIKGSRRRAFADLAGKLETSIDTVDSWVRGVRCIPEEKIEPLVRALGPEPSGEELTKESRLLANRLRNARQLAEPVLSWTEMVDGNRISLRVQQARYLGAGRLWGRIFFPFLDSADILHTKGGPTEHFDELQQAIWDGRLDVALGILATPRLSLKLWFFNSPIRYRLNCLTPVKAKGIGGGAEVRRALAYPRARVRLFVPIVMRGEIGESYGRNNLGLVDPIHVDSLSAAKFCEEFLAARADERRIPLVIVDEITCLEALIKLRGQAELVFPLVPKIPSRHTIIPPSFPLGLCVSRNERVEHARKGELRVFLREALPSYIAGNSHDIAFFYVALRNVIRRLVDRALPDCPASEREQWVKQTFSLGREFLPLQPPHWRAVLQEVLTAPWAGR